ncbi:MAG: hypothetical protein ACTTJS_05120 [Wolinella sp.]
MKKWQELTINAMMNFCIALMAGGVLKLVLDNQSIVSSIVTASAGAYALFVINLVAKSIERGEQHGRISLDFHRLGSNCYHRLLYS